MEIHRTVALYPAQASLDDASAVDGRLLEIDITIHLQPNRSNLQYKCCGHHFCLLTVWSAGNCER